MQRGYAWRAACVLGLASATRSNGIFTALVFLGADTLQKALITSSSRGMSASLSSLPVRDTWTKRLSCLLMLLPELLLHLPGLIIRISISVGPFIAFDFVASQALCSESRLVMLSRCLDRSTLQWEHIRFGTYSALQAEYWDVGLLKYWQFKQIPQFVLAFPVLYVGVQGGYGASFIDVILRVIF